ncbi:HFL248Wp [Eremothecium sinecaudum]|uniref:HFL248Wp n=1 Tax=Eremothecium sinecaudum TaxID=45286 RepID=A0A0X8HUE6_9SACH|nr:HFL248Wp [Eremothecium sinecaudum]AMD21608.1 HFL248Wp [Eremothecium sinecaudum]
MSEKKLESVTKDSRFSRIHNDPKFKQTRSKNVKIKLDDRFSKSDLEFKAKAKVDKYGRRIVDGKNKDAKDFDKYFVKDKESDEEEESDDNGKVAVVDRARGEVPSDYVSSSEEDTSSDSEEDSEDSEVEVESEEDTKEAPPPAGDASKTLAVVNLDWDYVRSVDLMVTFKSFVPKGGKIEKICIYPSEFGKERMKQEDVAGPPRELFKSKKKKSNDDDDSDVDINDLYDQEDGEKDYDSGALRKYQLERLRYYYAVVYCDDVSTAEAIYQNCDGTEYESTANMFDIRYVPDGVTFDDEPRDECDKVPNDYKPIQFSTSALQHSQVKLTWDETPADRVEMTKRAFSQKELDDMDFKAYLASDSDESEREISEEAKNKLKSLVTSSTKVANKSLFDEEAADDEEEADVEITFTPALENGEPQAAKDSDEISTIDKIKLKEKDRRKKRKERVKELKKQAEEEKKSKRHTTNSEDQDSEAARKNQAELELLMLDENETESKVNSKAHFNMKEIIRSEKEQFKRNKFQDKRKIVEDSFKPDLNDPRFQEVFEDRDFAIDPSQPEFKPTNAMKEILKERRNRSSKLSHSKKRKAEEPNNNNNISTLVNKLKNSSKKNKTK